jgi:hypothetical protein
MKMKFEGYMSVAKQIIDDAAEQWIDENSDEAFERAEEAIATIRFAIDEAKLELEEDE